MYGVMLSNIAPDYSTGFIFNSIRHYRVIELIDMMPCDFRAIKRKSYAEKIKLLIESSTLTFNTEYQFCYRFHWV